MISLVTMQEKMGEGSTGAVGAVAAFTAGRGLSQNMQNTGRQVTDTVKSFKAHKEKEANQQLENVKGFNSSLMILIKI